MDHQLKYERITKNSQHLDTIASLYTVSFPTAERIMTVEDIMKDEQLLEQSEITLVFDAAAPIAFYILTKYGKSRYIEYIAVAPGTRGKGYGGRILQKILRDFPDGVVFGSIEKPVPGEADYEAKLKRLHFYEKNGMAPVYRDRTCNGVLYMDVTTQTGSEFERCRDAMIQEEERVFSLYSKALLPSQRAKERSHEN